MNVMPMRLEHMDRDKHVAPGIVVRRELVGYAEVRRSFNGPTPKYRHVLLVDGERHTEGAHHPMVWMGRRIAATR